ncbi:LOW QUALITY PROTEIN: hypothetical protein HJC23_008262 [Cyclotella cryptica]|uniref:Uncharacterized protein n=1 Tax=Cyclotella cryptica TaxID=29204 RepID=A0ABD3NXK2_9STRA|eukprot:CCRYP_019122-RA/>CCRYP_019122-RA protein AED:0.26 eAED:0.26 QI:316/0.66/0.5/1/0.33/0/4/0/886
MKSLQIILLAICITIRIHLRCAPQIYQKTTSQQLTTTRNLKSPHTRLEILESASSSLSPSLVHIHILSPKNPRNHQYSVTVQSQNNYTGTAALISEAEATRPFPPLLFEWKPPFAGEYEILVHELKIDAEASVKTVPMDRIPLSIEKHDDADAAMDLIRERLKQYSHVPCASLDRADAYSIWDGYWLGPGLSLEEGRKLRNGWMFLPHESMNCTIPSYTQQDLLQLPEETSIYVFGTSRERGVFLSILDILLTAEEKEHLEASVIGKCWGRAIVQKGNIKLMYQDFRVINFEPPGSARFMECHNDKVAKLGDALFIENAWKVWEEIFAEEAEWPSVIYMLTDDGPNYDFEYHTKSFVTRLPQSWNGTLVLSDYSFTAKHPNMEYIEKHNDYRAELKQKINVLNDNRVRWLDGMGIAKEMRLYGEWGADHIAQSQHFHHFCNETYIDENFNVQSMNVCSNITEMVAHLLLSHALPSKELISERTEDSALDESNIDTTLRYCHSCPRRLLPFHITPYPDMTCEMGPFHERTDIDPQATVCTKLSTFDLEFCPEACMKEKVSWKFDSQSDVVDVRECIVEVLQHNDDDAIVRVDDIIEDPPTDGDPIPSWIRANLADVAGKQCRESDIPFYWLIPESGGTAIQELYWCLGLTIANEVGANPKLGRVKQMKLVKFLPFHGKEWPTLNVDTSTKEGILRAKQLGLASSNRPSVDLVVSSHLRFAAQELFDSTHKGKVFSIFRNPGSFCIAPPRDRRSIFSNVKYAKGHWMVRNLVGKEDSNQSVSTKDLELAKEIVRTKIIVGLESRFVKSFDRFNEYLGIKIHSQLRRGQCVREYARSNKEKGIAAGGLNSDQLKVIAEKNHLDVLLYEFVEGLFNEQGFVPEVNAEDSS